MRGKILHIAQWIIVAGIITFLVIGSLPKDEPKKEVFYIGLEQFPDGTFYLQYALDGQIWSAGFYDYNRFIDFTEYLKRNYRLSETDYIFQHGIDDLDLKTGRKK